MPLKVSFVMDNDHTCHNDPPPSLKVLSTVAELEGADETNLPLLSTVIDPDALNALFASSLSEKQKEPAYVTFPYADYRVMVYDDGTVIIK